ncbi:MAG: hypothetical protein CM15mP62_32320 [Rhodospirillaceae bacterium]|nr:MAG: hypothetical protein CM15mP62_32320 [Rhodospirillaceae bacterium]
MEIYFKVKQNVKIPVFANGDITCFDPGKSVLEGFDGRWYNGRPGLLWPPLVFSKLSHFFRELRKDPDLIEQKMS